MNTASKLSLNKETLQVISGTDRVIGGYTTINETDAYCNPSGAHACHPLITYGCPTTGQESMDTCDTNFHAIRR